MHTQDPDKLNVGGAGNFRDCIVGPYFLPENLAAEMDLDLLEITTDPDLMNAFEEAR